MAELPSANVSIDDQAGAFGGQTGYIVVLSCVEKNADSKPRVFASAKGLLTKHGYCAGADYVALHIQRTRKPIIFVAMETAVDGVLRRTDSSGMVGTSRITVAAIAAGYLDEVDAVVTVTKGGTVGTDQIKLTVSMDGGRTSKSVRLGTSTSYTVPYFGAVISFGAGTLVKDDVFRYRTTAPMWDGDGLALARTELAKQKKLARSFLVVGDLPDDTHAGYVTTQANAYETENQRFVYARANIRDGGPPSPLALMSKNRVAMSGSPTLTFAEVGATGDTITRSAGSWIDDGFAVGHIFTVAGSASNNVTSVIASLSATVITLDTVDLVAEVAAPNCTVVGSPGLTFAEVGATGDTITRTAGSFIDEGFKVGDKFSVTGSASNNLVEAPIAAVSATVITLGTTDLVAEAIASHKVTLTRVETMADWISDADTEFAGVDAQKRIDLGAGRARKLSPITGYELRRPISWAASIREYEHDLHIATWRKSDKPLDGWDLEDDDEQPVEFDERNDGGGLAARFTVARTWPNGPNGTFIAISLTREDEGSMLSRTHNLAVVNLACTVVQAETEMAIGQSLVLEKGGTATAASLGVIKSRVNTALANNLLKSGKEGPRASSADWEPSKTDILNVPGATLTGVTEVGLNGTLERVDTSVKVLTGG